MRPNDAMQPTPSAHHSTSPRWFRLLLLHQRERGYAATIPFLLGSLPRLLGNTGAAGSGSQAGLRSLIDDMLDRTPEPFVLRISRCDRLGQPVVAPWDTSTTIYRLHGVPLQSEIQRREVLFIDAEFVQGGLSSEAISTCLWRELGSTICQGKFSFIAGSYRDYDAQDRHLIERSAEYEYNDEA